MRLLTPMRTRLCGLMVALVATALNAQQSRPLTVNEAVTEALNRHPQLRRYRAEVEVSAARIGKARALSGFQTGLSLSYRRQGPVVEFPTPPAGTVRVVPDNLFTGSVTAQKLVFDGGRTRSERRVAELGTDIAREQVRETERMLIREVKRAFYALLKSERLREVADETLKIADEQLRLTRTRFAAGAAPRFDVTRSEVEVSNARQELITAEKNVEQARAALNSVLSRPVHDPLTVIGTPLSSAPEPSAAALTELAQQQRPELKLAERQVRVARERLRAAAAEHLPQVSLQSSYTRQTGSAFQENFNWFAGVGISFDLFNSGRTRAAVREARSAGVGATAGVDQQRQVITLEVKHAHIALREARQRIETTETTIRGARENLDIAKLRYENGLGINLEVMDAQVALSRARAQNVNAVYDYWLAWTELEAAVGKTLISE